LTAATVSSPLDVAIVGAGIAGVIHLHYARRAGLDARVFERGPAVGGLWRTLPAWQDIQISPADWALAGLPLDGALQPQVLANIEAWVRTFGLADGIALNTPVEQARREDGCWVLRTPAGSVRARHLVAATGAHNTPHIPAVARAGAAVQEWHSSELHDPSLLRGRDVLVAGGGASAFDLIDQCLAHGARRVSWAHRGLKWFVPTNKPKHLAGSVRGFARMQASGLDAAQQSQAINADMRGRYARFGIESIMPAHDFDVLKDQLIPGRPRMLSHFSAMRRLHGSVTAIRDRTIRLSGGDEVEADVLLWGTGYTLDLRWLDLPALADVRSSEDLVARCGCIFRSLDADNLYFPQTGLDGIGSATWAYALLARTIMSHIRGTARLDLVPVGHKVNHFDIVAHLAPRDPGSFAAQDWPARYRELALGTPDDQPYPLP
jgi:cation diffusion facilitator CzcD-associated flavoprotein CzcO